MTSTPFSVGLSDESRVSSRVLRPPGGGHTDIFGSEPEQPQRVGRRPAPNTAVVPPPAKVEPKVVAAKTTNGASGANGANGASGASQASVNGGGASPQEAPAQSPVEAPAEVPKQAPKEVSSEAPKQAPKQAPKEAAKPEPAKAEPPKRVRVPPGGFSSGLW